MGKAQDGRAVGETRGLVGLVGLLQTPPLSGPFVLVAQPPTIFSLQRDTQFRLSTRTN